MRIRLLQKRFLLLALVVGLGALLAWLDVYDVGPATQDPTARAQEPSHVVKNATLTLFGETGERHQVLSTPQLTHTPERAVTQLTDPHATLFDSQQRRWYVSANHGTIDQRERLTLSGSAQIRAPGEGWKLDTERLYYDSNTAHAYSDLPVLLQQTPQHIQAERMDVWLNEDALRLTGNVRGYHPVEVANEDDTQ